MMIALITNSHGDVAGNGGEVRRLLRQAPPLSVLLNICARALLLYFGAEAIQATISNPNDRRFAGKGIALRNALLVGAFSMLLPVLYHLGPKRQRFPWAADALVITVPVADMAGNSLDLYNRYGTFDLMTHFYGTAAVGGLMALAARGRNVRPALFRWFLAVSCTTFPHVLLEIQEYWTDVFFGTHNVEGLEDTEGDLLAGVCGAIAGVAVAEALMMRGGHIAAEARRLGATFESLARRADRRALLAFPGESKEAPEASQAKENPSPAGSEAAGDVT
jgi:hypothetical protein